MFRILILLVCSTGALCAQVQVTLDSLRVHGGEEDAFYLLRTKLNTLSYPVQSIRAGTQVLRFVPGANRLRYDSTYSVVNQRNERVQLAFTRLPVVSIRTQAVLNDTVKKPATLTYIDDRDTVVSDIGIRFRGNFSLRYPKKSLDIEFRESATGTDTRNVRFGSLREDDDWVLDALYNEPLRVNAYVAHKLWLDLHTPYYQEREERARAGADVMFVEVRWNGRYRGVYLLSEQVDRKQLRLKKKEDGRLRGELYKGNEGTPATRLLAAGNEPTLLDTVYGGWEMKYPDPTDRFGWGTLHAAIDFAARSTEEDFRREVGERFELANLIDYFIYVNVVHLTDNLSKNTYLARYREGEPYFYVPWDLDGSFGNRFDGKRVNRASGILSNGLYDRLLDEDPARFGERLCTRYRELRQNLLDPATLHDRLLGSIHHLDTLGVLGREGATWPGTLDHDADYIEFVREFTEERIAYLDTRLCAPTTSRGPAADDAPQIRLYPNPVTDRLTVERAAGARVGYSIFDLRGRPVVRGTTSGTRSVIDVSRLPAGVYNLRIGAAVYQLVVQP